MSSLVRRWSRSHPLERPYVEHAYRTPDGRDDVFRTREPVNRCRKTGLQHGEKLIEGTQLDARSPTTITTPCADCGYAEAWTRCATAMKDHEEARIQAWKEEIDTELVFAALFSAILTAFDVEVYKLLQAPDSDNSSGGPMAATQSADPYAVAINALWFSALICSVAAASISILVRQWLNQYTGGLASVSLDIARVRQFRRDGLKKWKVAEIMMLLPILLQGAVVLFLIGLVLFLHQLNGTITSVASVLVAMLLFFILITTILPTLKDDCSYQSPQAWGFFVIFQTLKRPLRSLCRTICSRMNMLAAPNAEGPFNRVRGRFAKKLVTRLAPFANKPNTYSWVARERILVEASGPLLDQHLIVEADATFLEDDFLRDVVRPCLNDMPPDAAVKSYYDIMAHRADRIENGLPYFDTRTDRVESVAILTELTLDALQRTRGEQPARDRAIRTMRVLEPLLVRTLPATYDQFCRVFFPLTDDLDAKVRHYAFSILYQQLWRNLPLADEHCLEGCHDLAALVKFMTCARQDGDSKHFLDACDLLICLATLPSLSTADYTALRDDLQDTLEHLRHFFETPLWRNDPMLLFPIARIGPHLVTLERKYPHALKDDFVDVLADVLEKARELNSSGNWEDKLQDLEKSFVELQALRQAPRAAASEETIR